MSQKGKRIQSSDDDVATLKRRIAELEGGKSSVTNVVQMDELIPVMSLLNYPLNLSTKERGQGDTYKFTRFGEIKRIPYSRLLSILEVHKNFVDWGYFVILDERVVKVHGLQEVYEKILTKEKIESILSGSEATVDLYQSCNEEQQKLIIGMVIDKLAADTESIDLNVIDKLSRISGIKIMEKVDDARETLSLGVGAVA